MTITQAEKSVKRWKRWAACVRSRWMPDSPMIELADRMVQDAEKRLTVIQTQQERE